MTTWLSALLVQLCLHFVPLSVLWQSEFYCQQISIPRLGGQRCPHPEGRFPAVQPRITARGVRGYAICSRRPAVARKGAGPATRTGGERHPVFRSGHEDFGKQVRMSLQPKVSVLVLFVRFRPNKVGYPTCGPPGCVMQPAATFLSYVFIYSAVCLTTGP